METEPIEDPTLDRETANKLARNFRGWKKLPLIPLFALFVVPLMLLLGVVALISIVVTFVMMILQNKAERRFVLLMRSKDRFVDWSELEPELLAGRGTLILEQGGKAPIRCWWTPDNVAAISPFKIPDQKQLHSFLTPVFGEQQPFVPWCDSQYLNIRTGKALLTVPSIEVPPGYGHAGFFQDRYPGLVAIDTVYSLPFPRNKKTPDLLDQPI